MLATIDIQHVHIQHICIAEHITRCAALAETLSPDEHARAARYHSLEQQQRFIIGRGILREILGRHVDQPASALCFFQGPHGKLALVDENTVHFNLSHSGDRMLYAVGDRPLGVDIECHDRTVNHAQLMQRICTAREWAAFQALPHAQWHAAFFDCWTRKEAMVKAVGCGLAGGLRQFDVWATEKTSVHYGAQAWCVRTLPIAAGWSAALAIQER